MRTIVFGAGGQLGRSIVGSVSDGVTVFAYDRSEVDITNSADLHRVCDEVGPDLIVNAAAYTAVDRAESEPDLAYAVNVAGARNVAIAAQGVGARLIHISTDYVFDGKSSLPYQIDSPTNPINVYGRTKRDGEIATLVETDGAAIVLRTARLYSPFGNNFVKTMLRLMAEGDSLSVVADQRGTPTSADSLSTTVWDLAGVPELDGIFHWTAAGECSWYEFAVAIQEDALSHGLLRAKIPVSALTTPEYPTAAVRPRYTVLDCSTTCAALSSKALPWRDNLRLMIKRMSI